MDRLFEKTSFKIGAHKYKLILNYKWRERNDLCGQADHQNLEIKLSGTDQAGNPLKLSRLTEMLLHEIIHAINNAWKIADLKEDEVERAGEAVLAFLVDNNFVDVKEDDHGC